MKIRWQGVAHLLETGGIYVTAILILANGTAVAIHPDVCTVGKEAVQIEVSQNGVRVDLHKSDINILDLRQCGEWLDRLHRTASVLAIGMFAILVRLMVGLIILVITWHHHFTGLISFAVRMWLQMVVSSVEGRHLDEQAQHAEMRKLGQLDGNFGQ